MATYPINKGIDKPVEFKGLKAQYLLYGAGGLTGIFLVFTGLYLLGFNRYGCTTWLVAATGLWLYLVFHWNRVYGRHGLLKKRAAARRPAYLVNQGYTRKLITYKP